MTSTTVAIAALALFAGDLWGGSVTGRVRITNASGSVANKGDESGVAVWLTAVSGETQPPAVKHAVMLQKNKTFKPHVLTIGTGSIIDFPNEDPIFHNAFSNFNGQIFDVSLYPPGSSRAVRFSRPGVVRVFCNIHPTMSAVIVVVDTAFFTTTGREGTFEFSNVPAGTYELRFFHERATAETLAKVTKTVEVQSRADAGRIDISETGYLPILHKNKYGKDYPPHAGEEPGYSLPQ